MGLYDRIKELAKQKDLSIYRIERETGLSNGAISKWNKVGPNSVNLFKVAKYLEVDPGELMKPTSSKKE